MAYIADLHIHSRFARACSPQLNLSTLAEWSKYKGINLMGTGDFLHPLWFSEIKNQLKEDGSGFLTLAGSDVKFVLSVEVASIYNHKGGNRRVHNLVFMPSLESASKFYQSIIAKRANLASDGRPIVGISSKDLLQMALQADEKAIFIPAHIWTPWFGVLGSKSGYDQLTDCFEDLTDNIYGIETGLSSDPAMNWRIGQLDNKALLSFSDAHSLPNLGREVVVFSNNLQEGYSGLLKAIKSQQIIGTVEFYPEEGIYHYTGHRSCNVKYSPEDEIKNGIICPVCGKPLTVGVMSRVEELATRTEAELGIKKDGEMIKSAKFPNRPGYRMLIPLNQVIAEAFNVAKTSQKVLVEYKKLVGVLGGEIKVLIKVSIDDIAKISGERVAEGVDKIRKGDLVIDPGYDGLYGVVKIWREGEEAEKEEQKPQLGLFD